MSHMVIFRNSEGKSGNHMTESLEDAVRFVEHLRNNEQVTDARVFRMQEVPLEFKVMYKVEINDLPGAAASGGDASAGPAPAAATPQPAGPPPAPAPAPEAAAPAMSAPPAPAADAGAPAAPTGEDGGTEGGGRFGLFSRS